MGTENDYIISNIKDRLIKMRPHPLINNINKPVLNLYFRFEFFIRKLYTLCTSLIIPGLISDPGGPLRIFMGRDVSLTLQTPHPFHIF